MALAVLIPRLNSPSFKILLQEGIHIINVQRANIEMQRRFFSLRILFAWNLLTAERICAENLDTLESLLHRDLGEQMFESS